MYPCRLDLRQRHDASREFALESALIIDLLLKVSETEIRLIEDLKTDTAAGRHSLACELDSNFRCFFRRNADGAAVCGQLVIDLHFLKLLDHALRVRRLQIRKHDLKVNTVGKEYGQP